MREMLKKKRKRKEKKKKKEKRIGVHSSIYIFIIGAKSRGVSKMKRLAVFHIYTSTHQTK
jgi:hypothetical protein